MPHLIIIDHSHLPLHLSNQPPRTLYRFQHHRGLTSTGVILSQTSGNMNGRLLVAHLSLPPTPLVGLGLPHRTGLRLRATNKSGMFLLSTRWVLRGVFKSPATQPRPQMPSRLPRCLAPIMDGLSGAPDTLDKSPPCRQPVAPAWLATSTRCSTLPILLKDQTRTSK